MNIFIQIKLLPIMLLKTITSCLLAIHNGTTFSIKIKSALTLAVIAAPPVLLLEYLSEWWTHNYIYTAYVFIAIFIDWITGNIVHAFIKRDWNMKKNIIGLSTKIAMVLTVGVLFEGVGYVGGGGDSAISYTMITILRLLVLIYPTVSALMNCAEITGGAFPPVSLIERLKRFNKDLDINHLKPKKDNDN